MTVLEVRLITALWSDAGERVAVHPLRADDVLVQPADHRTGADALRSLPQIATERVRQIPGGGSGAAGWRLLLEPPVNAR